MSKPCVIVTIYTSGMRSYLIHGSETWPMKVEHEMKLHRTEMNIIRWICGLTLIERKRSAELRESLSLMPVNLVIRKEA